MKTYRQLRRTRKIKMFGKKVGIAILFLGISYLLSLLSFYLYTKLSQVLQPVEKGFIGFAVIGLIAGLIAILASFLNKRLILTVVISFAIDCLVDSVVLYSKLGTQVAQYLPGLLVSMTSVIASWHYLKRRLWLPKNSIQGTREQFNKKYALARNLLENPDKLTLEVFKEACEALQGINPKIDALLKEADHVSRAISFLNGGDPIGLAVSLINVKTEKDKEKKEKLLFFIDLVNDIWEEVNLSYTRLPPEDPGNYVDHPVKQLGNSILASSGPAGLATISMAFVVATSVAATNTASIGSMLPKNDFLSPEEQPSQEINQLTQTATLTILPTETPTPNPTNKPALVFSAVEKTFFVSAASQEGENFNASSTGTYRFTITGGASEICPQKSQPDNPELWGWNTMVVIYKNRSIVWSGSSNYGPSPSSWNYMIGSPTLRSTFAEAEKLGKGDFVDIYLGQGQYVIFLVNDCQSCYGDNSGGINLQVQRNI